MGMHSPEQLTNWFMPAQILFLVIHLLGLSCFAFIVAKRMAPLLQGEKDFRFDRPLSR